MKRKTYIWGVFFFLVIVLPTFYFSVEYYRTVRAERLVNEFINSKYWTQKAEAIVEKSSNHKGGWVFLGNSITEGMDLDKYIEEETVNMGISGDFTKGVVSRIKIIEKIQPEKVFIMIGINDIIEKVPNKVVLVNYFNLIEQLFRVLPHSQLYIQSILPVHGRYSVFTSTENINKRVIEINSYLKVYANSKNIQYIDHYSLLEKNCELDKNYTYDGIHLNSHGYDILFRNLQGYIGQ